MTDTILNGLESRAPITNTAAWIDNLEEDSRRALVALGELLVGAADRPRPETATAFTERCLGVDSSRKLIDEDIVLSGVQALTYALALAELITEHSAETGPSEHLDPPSWTQTPVGETVYHHPAALRASFPAGTMLPDVASVIQIRTKRAYGQDPEITVYVRREHQAQARNVLDRISERANELHPYRGRAVRACMRMGLVLEVITLPAGSTPVDFAYAVHTEVGHRCIGARVNGRLVALERKLENGEVVEVFTSKAQNAGPSRDWQTFVVSPRAKAKIRQWFAKERREEALENGKDAIVKEVRRGGLPIQRLMNAESMGAIAKELRYTDVSALYTAVGENHVSARHVVNRLVAMLGP